MKPIPLTLPDGTVGLWRCSKCGQHFISQEPCEKCCICNTCGKEMSNKHDPLDCPECREERRESLKKALLDKAEDVTDSYDGPITFNEKYYDDIDAVLDDLYEQYEDEKDEREEEGEEFFVPEFIFASKPDALKDHDARRLGHMIRDNALYGIDTDDLDEDAGLVGMNELYTNIEAWLKKQTLVVYREDKTKKIALRKLWEKAKKEQGF